MFSWRVNMALNDLEQALAKRADLREKIQQLREEMDRLHRSLATASSELGYVDGYIDATYREMAKGAKIHTRESREPIESPAEPLENPDRQDVVTAALELIRLAGRPLARKTIFEGLENQGIVIHGKNPLMVLSTMLWRTQERIIRLPPFGYWPADRPYEPANYIPGTPQPELFTS
jgi:hypothetical protein